MSIIEELKKDAEEFAKLLGQTERHRVKDALIAAKAEVDKEILTLEIKERLAAERKAAAAGENGAPKRYLIELTEYAWDQSDKFVKLFITLDGVQNLEESSAIVDFTENSMQLHVSNLNGKDYGLTVNNLLEPIDVERSYRKLKTGLVAIYMRKKKDAVHWDHLTTIQKRLKQKHETEMKSEAEGGEDALVNIMKKMYNSGDTKTKQMIAKAWTESQDKARIDPSLNPALGDL